MGRKKV